MQRIQHETIELILESKLKELLEKVIQQLEIFVRKPEQAKIVESKLHDYDNLVELATITIDVYDYFVERMHTKFEKLRTYKFLFNQQHGDGDFNKLAEYQKLETQAQKYEEEIRNHIKIEQQLKLFSEQIQDNLTLTQENLNEIEIEKIKIEEKLKQTSESKSSLELQLKQFEEKNLELKEQLSKLEENYYIIMGGQNSVNQNELNNLIDINPQQSKQCIKPLIQLKGYFKGNYQKKRERELQQYSFIVSILKLFITGQDFEYNKKLALVKCLRRN